MIEAASSFLSPLGWGFAAGLVVALIVQHNQIADLRRRLDSATPPRPAAPAVAVDNSRPKGL